MSLDQILGFWEWFDSTRKDISIRQIEKRAGCPRGRIGNAYTNKRQPSLEVCQSIADGLVLPINDVLTYAGLLEPEKIEDEDISIRKVVEYMRRLNPDERQMIREYAEWRYQTQTKETNQ
jgi:transcriptional regulator with XRE-family HTH domain